MNTLNVAVRLVAPQVRLIAALLRASGPYLLIELLLPGGTLLALGLFLWRRRAHINVWDPASIRTALRLRVARVAAAPEIR